MNISKKKNILHLFLLALSICSLLFLGACNGISAEDMENYPESVQDGTVSVEYYKQINSFYEENYTISQSMMKILETQISLVELRGEMSTIGNEYDVMKTIEEMVERLGKYSTKPKTEADKAIDFQFEKAIYILEEVSEFELKVMSGEEFNMLEAKTLHSLMNSLLRDFDDVVENYGIK